MSEHESEPWYRQFWPWFLILLPASAVVASLYSVSLAVRTTDSLVTSAPDGMDVVTERVLAAEKFASDIGLTASLEIDATSGAIRAVLTSRLSFERPKTLELLFSHPTLASRDRAIKLTAAMPDTDGRSTWAGNLINPPGGRWYVVLKSADDWRLSTVWSGERVLYLMSAETPEPE